MTTVQLQIGQVESTLRYAAMQQQLSLHYLTR